MGGESDDTNDGIGGRTSQEVSAVTAAERGRPSGAGTAAYRPGGCGGDDGGGGRAPTGPFIGAHSVAILNSAPINSFYTCVSTRLFGCWKPCGERSQSSQTAPRLTASQPTSFRVNWVSSPWLRPIAEQVYIGWRPVFAVPQRSSLSAFTCSVRRLHFDWLSPRRTESLHGHSIQTKRGQFGRE